MGCKIQEEAENPLDGVLCRIAAFRDVSDVSVVSYDSKGNTVASTKIVTHPETVYVVDGKVITADEFMAIFPSKIESIKIVKSKDNPDFQKYAKANTEVVMMITTKK